MVTDLLSWQPPRRYRVWHDRAVFHFLTDPADQARYRELLDAALAPGAALAIGTFAADGPDHCSGLPTARYGPDQLSAVLGTNIEPVTSRRELHRTPVGSRPAVHLARGPSPLICRPCAGPDRTRLDALMSTGQCV